MAGGWGQYNRGPKDGCKKSKRTMDLERGHRAVHLQGEVQACCAIQQRKRKRAVHTARQTNG